MRRYPYILLLFLLATTGLIAQTPAELRSWLPEIPGWTIKEELEVFDADNLFDRINGAAPLFIENNFVEMTSMEYLFGNDYITIQAYRHATPEDAFGMYASERTEGLTHYPIGGEAQGDANSLFLFAGNIYIKMWASTAGKAEATLHTIGESLAQAIDPHADYPKLFEAFPDRGKLLFSEAYITANYIGHQFLNRVALVKYVSEGKEFQLFIVNGDTPDGAKEILSKYYTFARQEPALSEGEHLVKDRYNGDIPIYLKGQYLVGIFSENGDILPEASELLAETAAKLP
ncbi:hypothetical protein LJC35_03720 [Parabacteroides sp. OttesenSCG-928-N08]|nr:hypothetical protein [Parabacteroides sp. OttesenSCG-928-N08]